MEESKKEATAAERREIGNRLRDARHAAGLSLSQLSDKTGGAYSKSRISNYEQGLRRPKNYDIGVLADQLGVTVGWVARGEAGKKRSAKRAGGA